MVATHAERREEHEREHERLRRPLGQHPGDDRPAGAPAGLGERREQGGAILVRRRVELHQRRGRRAADHPHRQPLHGARGEQPRQPGGDREQHQAGVAVANPAAITRRRPSRSESCPNSSSEGARHSA